MTKKTFYARGIDNKAFLSYNHIYRLNPSTMD